MAPRSRLDLGWGERLQLLAIWIAWGIALLEIPGSGPALRAEMLGPPLTTLGLWLLSLFLLRTQSPTGSARLVQVGVLGYAYYYALQHPVGFVMGGLCWAGLLAWGLFLALEIPACAAGRTRKAWTLLWAATFALGLWLVAAGDFRHLLYLALLLAFFLVRGLARVKERHPRIPRFWVQLPAWLLLLGGAYVAWDHAEDFPGRNTINAPFEKR